MLLTKANKQRPNLLKFYINISYVVMKVNGVFIFGKSMYRLTDILGNMLKFVEKKSFAIFSVLM